MIELHLLSLRIELIKENYVPLFLKSSFVLVNIIQLILSTSSTPKIKNKENFIRLEMFLIRLILIYLYL